MRALVLAGGEGTRLRPLTYATAKQLIPVGGRPVLFHALEDIHEAGIREVGIIVGATAEEIRAAVGDGSPWGLDVTYIHQEAPLGLAHAVLTARDFVEGRPFLMYLGDNVLPEGLTRFVQEFEQTRPDAQIFLARVPEPERFGVVVLDGERVIRLVEKPKEFVSDLALVGVYLFRDSILEACDQLSPSWRGEYEITEAIQWLVDHGRTVRAQQVTGWWKDTGKVEDLLEANRTLLSLRNHAIKGEVDLASTVVGDVSVASGVTVVRSRIVGPVAIGPDTTVEDSEIGPNVSLDRGCVVTKSSIRDSIVMEGCRIADVHGLVDSILGRNVELRHAGVRGAHRLVVGDHSRIDVD
jgi:glucose-1-phosphate thymidylyltransferase